MAMKIKIYNNEFYNRRLHNDFNTIYVKKRQDDKMYQITTGYVWFMNTSFLLLKFLTYFSATNATVWS